MKFCVITEAAVTSSTHRTTKTVNLNMFINVLVVDFNVY